MTPLQTGLFTALGVGLLIGLMRERRKDEPDAGPSAAGLRTHALAALAAAVAYHVHLAAFIAVLLIGGALIIVSYRRTAAIDLGLTGEITLLLTTLLGALAMENPGLAASLGVATALLLHLRTELHHLGRELISERELHDGLLLAASAIIILPLLPAEPVDPLGVIVPAALWKLVVLVMAAGVAGQVALRLVGARYGLAVAGFFAGFASSTAATAGYGQRARQSARLLPYAASAALLANLATLLLLVIVLAASNLALVRAAAWPLAAAGLTLLVAASAGILDGGTSGKDLPGSEETRAFKVSHALALAAFVAALLVVSALLERSVGDAGALAAAIIAGMVELQGAALAIGQMASRGTLDAREASWGLVALLGASSAVKATLAFGSGGRAYGLRVALGLGGAVLAAAAAAWVGGP